MEKWSTGIDPDMTIDCVVNFEVGSSVEILTHISLASNFWDISKQCRPRSDAAERGRLAQNAASD